MEIKDKKAKFIITVVWILFTRTYDAICTYRLTPDLSKESNPLVSVFGMGWFPLILTIGLLSIYIIYCYYLSMFKPKDLSPEEKGFSFGNFIAYIYLGWKDSWTAMFYKFPKDINRFNQFVGKIFTRCLVFVGFISTIMWILINNSAFYRKIHSVLLVDGTILLGCFLIIYIWNRIIYKKYITSR